MYKLNLLNITGLKNHQSGGDRVDIPETRAARFYVAKATLYGVTLSGIILESTANN